MRINRSIGLLGEEVVELIFGDETVLVEICSFDHFQKFVIVVKFSEFFGDFSEILEGDVSGSLGVEGDEDFVDFVSAFVGGWSGGHHIEEFVKFDLSATVFIELSNHGIDSLSLGLDTQGVDCGFEFSRIN